MIVKVYENLHFPGAARGCKLEVAQRDVYRIGKDVGKVRRYVELARRALEG